MLTDLLLAGLLLTQAPAPTPEPPNAPPALSELHTAQVSAHLAKLRALDAEIRLQQMLLALERERLDAAIAAAYPTYVIDWTKGQLVPVPPKDPK